MKAWVWDLLLVVLVAEVSVAGFVLMMHLTGYMMCIR